MTARIRIRCRPPIPTQPTGSTLPIINGVIPSLEDCEVDFIQPDGSAVPIHCERFSVSAEPNQAVTATLTILSPELDIECFAEATKT